MTERDSREVSEFLAGVSHDLRTPLSSLLILAGLLAENPDGNLTAKQVEFARTILASGNELLELANLIRDRSIDGGTPGRPVGEAPPVVRDREFDDDRDSLTPTDHVVLIVEDDASFATLLLETARGAGLKGVIADRGDTGLALAHAIGPDAIVLDLGLPVLDGAGLIERLKSHPATREIPIHVITGLAGAPDQNGIASMLEKPVALEDLTALFTGIVADAPDRRADEGQARHPDADSGPADVLIVDDRAENLTALTAVLEPLGARIVTADSGREALRLVLAQQFAVILLDVQMPDMDGLETAAFIRRRAETRSIPIIFLTGVSATPEHVFRGYEAGAVDYIVKPVDPAILRSKVAVFVELFEKNREIARQARLLQEQEQERLAREAAEQRHRRSRFLASVSAALEKRIDVAGRAGLLAQTCIPELGDFALVQLVQPDGVIEVAAVASRGGHSDALRRLVGIRRNPPAFASWVFEEPRARLFDPVTLDTWRELGLGSEGESVGVRLGLHSMVAAPLALGRRSVGVLVLGAGPGSESYGDERLELAKDIGRRAAMAVENARLFEAEQERSKALQLSLLGRPQVTATGVTAAMRYLPGSAELEVGGDWYDLLEREDGRILVAVGDVVGHGVQAATAMGKLRSAMGALGLVVDSTPALIGRLDQFAEKIEEARFGTVAAVLLEPSTGELSYSLAGHPPPLIVHADGRSELLEGGGGLPLCIEDRTGQPRPEGRATLPEGSTLILYTDGLIERRAISIDSGLERLRRAVTARFDQEPERLCDEIVEEFAEGSLDDLVFLCVRRELTGTRIFSRSFPAVPSSLAPVRQELRAWLGEQGLERRRFDAIIQACGEGCANAVRHAYGEQPGEGILELRLRADGRLVVRIRDSGVWREQAHAESSGHGMEIMRALSDDVHVHTTPQGTTVVLETTIHEPGAPIMSSRERDEATMGADPGG